MVTRKEHKEYLELVKNHKDDPDFCQKEKELIRRHASAEAARRFRWMHKGLSSGNPIRREAVFIRAYLQSFYFSLRPLYFARPISGYKKIRAQVQESFEFYNRRHGNGNQR